DRLAGGEQSMQPPGFGPAGEQGVDRARLGPGAYPGEAAQDAGALEPVLRLESSLVRTVRIAVGAGSIRLACRERQPRHGARIGDGDRQGGLAPMDPRVGGIRLDQFDRPAPDGAGEHAEGGGPAQAPRAAGSAGRMASTMSVTACCTSASSLTARLIATSQARRAPMPRRTSVAA